jgi:hypothetical protein
VSEAVLVTPAYAAEMVTGVEVALLPPIGYVHACTCRRRRSNLSLGFDRYGDSSSTKGAYLAQWGVARLWSCRHRRATHLAELP